MVEITIKIPSDKRERLSILNPEYLKSSSELTLKP